MIDVTDVEYAYMQSRSGFTIVELLIVIVVIGILTSITVVAFNGIRNRAIVSSVSSDTRNNVGKIKRFQTENNRYPSGDGEITDLGNAGYGLRISSASYLRAHPQSSSTQYMWSCYFTYDSSKGFPGPNNADGMLIVSTTNNGKVLAASTESFAVKDITSIFEAEATAGTNNIPCRSGAAAYGIIIGGINNIGAYVPSG